MNGEEDDMLPMDDTNDEERPPSGISSITSAPSSLEEEEQQKSSMETQMPHPQVYLERTLAIVKPDAMHKVDEIEDIILRNGFSILQKRKVHLSPEQASDFYVEHYGKMFFPSLVAYMSSAPIAVLVLAKEQAISSWRELLGPTNPFKARETHPGCLRDQYGKDQMRNALHGSETYLASEREIRFLFPNNVIEPLSIGQSAKDYLSKEVNPTLLVGLTELCKKKPGDAVTWLADWLIDNNPNKPCVKDPIVTAA